MPNVLAVALAAIAISAAVAVLHRGLFAQLSDLERSLYFFLVSPPIATASASTPTTGSALSSS